MVARVQKTSQGYVIPLTAEMVLHLQVAEGSEVELQPISAEKHVHYASVEDSLASFERTRLQHENSYRALAK